MTQNYELELNDQLLAELETQISREDTIMESDAKLLEELEDQIYVAKVKFAESVTKAITVMEDVCGIDEELFSRMNSVGENRIDKMNQDYLFTVESAATVMSISKSGIYKPLSLIGGFERFFPSDVVVDAISSKIIFRLRPLYLTSAYKIELHLQLDAEESDESAFSVLGSEFKAYIERVFAVEYKEVNITVGNLITEFNRITAMKDITAKYSVDVW